MTGEAVGFPVFYDVQSLQNKWSAERGIGRYVSELLDAIDRLDPDRIPFLLLNPDLPTPRSLSERGRSGRLVFSDQLEHQEVGVLHIPSPHEPSPLERLWPPELRSLRLVVTVHDLIPDVFRSAYLSDVCARRSYRARLELIRLADRVLAPSRATVSDVQRRLGVNGRRIVLTPEGVSDDFKPGDSAIALRALREEFPRVRADFVLYTGGVDPRKNIGRLLAAYSRLGSDLRKSHQLVMVSGIPPAAQERVMQEARQLRIHESVVFTGFVPDALLVRFYQAARVLVVPSLYEGFGLPIVEALACETPLLAARAPGAIELVDPDSTFDPYDVEDLATALRQSLVEDRAVERLRGPRPVRHTWNETAKRTVSAYEGLAQPATDGA